MSAASSSTVPSTAASTSASSSSSDPPPRKRARTSAAAERRLRKDWEQLTEEPPNGCSAVPIAEDNLFMWRASVFGPDESPFEGGVFELHMTFDAEYPLQPPAVRFVTEVFHPNVYPTGELCLDILQDAWSPVQTIASILTSIRSLLDDPNIASPANVDAAKLYRTDLRAYKRKIRKMVAASDL